MTEFLQCGTCNESQGPLDKCDDCKIVRYCSAACKIKHAPIHALACVRAVGAVTAVASTISVDAATAANVNATPTSTIAAANRTAATASAVAATATTASATKATKATTVVTDANTTDYKSDGHSNVHQHNSMPSLSETQKEAHTNAMTQFIGDHWGHLYECYLRISSPSLLCVGAPFHAYWIFLSNLQTTTHFWSCPISTAIRSSTAKSNALSIPKVTICNKAVLLLTYCIHTFSLQTSPRLRLQTSGLVPRVVCSLSIGQQKNSNLFL